MAFKIVDLMTHVLPAGHPDQDVLGWQCPDVQQTACKPKTHTDCSDEPHTPCTHCTGTCTDVPTKKPRAEKEALARVHHDLDILMRQLEEALVDGDGHE